MNDSQVQTLTPTRRLALFLGFILVIMGMANNLPNIPGLVETVRLIPGLEELPRLSKYNPEYFFPLTFVFMVVISLLGASLTQSWWNEPIHKKSLGIFLDLSLLLITVFVVVGYLIEHDQVCLIDQITGERARLMAADAARAQEQMALFGTVFTEELPDCQATIGGWVIPLLLAAMAIYFVYIIKVWGFPIAAVAIVVTNCVSF